MDSRYSSVVIKWLKSNLSRHQRSRFKHNLKTMIRISIYNKFQSFFQFPYYIQSLFKKAHLDMRHRAPAYTRRVKYRIFSNKICLFVPYGLITKTCRKMNILPFLFLPKWDCAGEIQFVHTKRDCLKKAKNIPYWNIGKRNILAHFSA